MTYIIYTLIASITYRIRGGWRPLRLIPKRTTAGRIAWVITLTAICVIYTTEWWRLLGFSILLYGATTLGHGAMLANGRNLLNFPPTHIDGEKPIVWIIGFIEYIWEPGKRRVYCLKGWGIVEFIRALPFLMLIGVVALKSLLLYIALMTLIGFIYELGWQTYYRMCGKDATHVNEIMVGAYKVGMPLLLF